jgi:hypothetical protein
MPLIVSVVLAVGSVLAATTAILIPQVELGAGVSQKPTCLTDSLVDYTTSTSGTLSEITISGIGSDCAGQWIRISLYSSTDGTGDPLEQVAWLLPATDPQVSAFTARADGTTTGTSGSVVWPTTEDGTSGLSIDNPIAVANINSFLLETSDSSISDSY